MNTFDRWYKKIVESNAESPPEKAWHAIEDELDIEAVWGRLNKELNTNRKTRFLTIVSAAASVLIIIGIGSIMFWQQPTEIIVANMESTVKQTTTMQDSSEEILSTHQIERMDDQKTILPATKAEKTKENGDFLLAQSTTIEPIDTFEQEFKTILNSIETIQASSLYFLVNKINIPSIETQPKKAQLEENRGFTPSLYAGLTGQLANTWLLSNKTLEGMKSSEFTSTHASFGTSAGFHVGTHLSPRLKTQADFFWIAQSRQNYSEYHFGQYVDNNLKLDYYNLSITFSYQLKALGRNHQLIGGSYVGYMRNARQNIGGATHLINEDYSNWDYGLVLGYGYPINLGDRLTLTAGLISKVGLKNIFEGNDIVPYYLNRTQNVSLNFNLSLSYTIF